MKWDKKWASTITASLIAFFILWWRAEWSRDGALLAVIFAIIVANLFFVGWKAWETKKEKEEGFPPKDEMTLYIEGRAAYYALRSGLWFMLALLWYTWFIHVFNLSLPEPNTFEALIMSTLFMSLLFLGLKWNFGRTGNIR
ncbi:hypothetical protein [Palaeococcus pacificus]|uniref:hypothetical protein n=1 Tax=Palaeococcus pacificus TaxID=971279 RepID=UPI001185C9F5|nr:hypothetical protein [Palaeococcus pacificus]